MAIDHTHEPPPRKPLRLWPGVVVIALLVLIRVVALFVPDAIPLGIIGGFLCGPLIIVWWLFFSRAPWIERLGALVAIPVALFATSRIVHESISNGMMGMLFYIYAIPLVSAAFVAWAVLSRGLSPTLRGASMVAAVFLGCGVLAFVRTGGIDGDAGSDFHWRWTPTPEERLLARGGDEPVTRPSAPVAATSAPGAATTAAPATSAPAAATDATAAPPAPAAATATATATATEKTTEKAAATADKEPSSTPAPGAAATTSGTPASTARRGAEDPATAAGAAAAATAAADPAADPAGTKARAEWPGFRGPARDSVVRGVQIETDWSKSPPVELWRRPIGPGWSSFAVRGDLVYTQEQRGNDELVSCYRLTSGEPVWRHRDAARFWESNAGAGPRATPTISGDRVYSFGATGILNALDARDGSVIWSRNAAADTGKTIPIWGFASSPLIVGDLVIVAAEGALAAYDLATGKPRWFGSTRGWGYSSPHLSTIGGVAQILLLNGAGAIGVAPADGALLWTHAWRGDGIVQPAVIANGDVLIGTGSGLGGGTGMGVRRVAVTQGSGGWRAEERWTSIGLKPYFNDFVVHEGHAFGFDGSILACIDLENGTRKWKGGRYGHGQVVVLPDQDLLLVLSEEGELALVGAVPDQYRELARVPALEGKTWNHPVLVGDVLLVRNAEHMAAFRLSLAGR